MCTTGGKGIAYTLVTPQDNHFTADLVRNLVSYFVLYSQSQFEIPLLFLRSYHDGNTRLITVILFVLGCHIVSNLFIFSSSSLIDLGRSKSSCP